MSFVKLLMVLRKHLAKGFFFYTLKIIEKTYLLDKGSVSDMLPEEKAKYKKWACKNTEALKIQGTQIAYLYI